MSLGRIGRCLNLGEPSMTAYLGQQWWCSRQYSLNAMLSFGSVRSTPSDMGDFLPPESRSFLGVYRHSSFGDDEV